MRDIEFRGKDKATGEWRYGYFRINPWTKTPVIDSAHSHQSWEVIPETVGQYTGLKDSNGVKIFEGDTVDFTYWWLDGCHEGHLTGEIIYIKDEMSFGLKGVKNSEWIQHIGGEEGSNDMAAFATWNFDEADFLVLGNIHDNPELLNCQIEENKQ